MIHQKEFVAEREALVEKAAAQYFRLFVQDWAERNNIQAESYEEMIALLGDSFLFIEEYVKETEFVTLFKKINEQEPTSIAC